MSDQREFWNARFEREGYFYGVTPNLYLKSHLDTLTPSQNLLFLGEGEGRNAVYAAKLGHNVTALDASDIGLAKASMLAHQHNTSISLIHTDLEQWKPDCAYDAIMCSFLHLQEPLRSEVFAKALDHLHSGGIFAGEFFSLEQLPRTTGGPKDENLLYTAEALEAILQNLQCTVIELVELDVQLQEGSGHNGLASVVRLAVTKK